MQITLGSFKHMPSLSEETLCFSATVLIDGEKVGTVSNRGHGGSHVFFPPALVTRLDAYAKTLPLLSYRGDPIPMDADLLIDQLTTTLLQKQELQKALKHRVLFLTPEGIMETSKTAAGQMPLTVERIRTQHPGATILNTLPLEEALTL